MRAKQGNSTRRQLTVAATTANLIQRWIIAVVLAWVALSANAAHADQWSLLINGKAFHLDEPEEDFNEWNWGAGVQYDFDVTPRNWVPFINASGFKDSNGNPSYYAGAGTARRFYFGKGSGALHLDVGAVALLMVRKDYNDEDPFLAALPLVSFGTDRIALNATYIPEVGPIDVPVLFLQLKIGLK